MKATEIFSLRWPSFGVKLLLLATTLCLLLNINTLWASGLMNAFNLELIRLWEPVTLELTHQNCIPVQDTDTLQKMQSWLNTASGFISDANHHQGELYCLKGDVQLAKEIWRGDVEHLFSALFAALISFSQDEFIEIPYAAQIGKYGLLNGYQTEQNENYSEAIPWYIFSITYAPAIHTANKLEYIHHLQGDREKAENLWVELTQTVSPDFPLYWWAKGKVAIIEGNRSDAGDYFYQGALRAEAKEAYRAYVQAGMVWYQVGEYDNARDVLQRALLLDADFSRGDLNELAPYLWLARIAQAEEKYGEALDYLNQALIIDPKSSGTLYEKAINLDALGRREESMAALTDAIAHHPNPPETWIALLEEWNK